MANEATAPSAAPAPDDSREAIEKAMHIISFDDVPQTNVREQEQRRIAGLFSEASALEPPYSLDELGTRVECSNILRQCIDAMVTNCDRFGYRLVPVIDPEHEDADRLIADVIYLERLDAAEDQGEADVPEPTAAEVQARKKLVVSEMRKERARLTAFLDYCCPELSFIELRARGHQDKETNGNWFWEVIRNGLGRIAELIHSVKKAA